MEQITQPDFDLQAKLDELYEATPEEITFRGRKVKIGWLRNYTMRRFSHVMAKEDNIEKRHAKLVAIVLLNNMWLIVPFYWMLWRWYYYIVDLNVVEVLKVLDAAKKKIQQEPFYLAIILSTGMTDLMMTMTSQEAKHIQAAQRGGQRTA
jgi:hypothetical protein